MNLFKPDLKKTLVFFFFLIAIFAFAYDPVAGGDEKNKLQSTAVMGGQGSVTGGALGDTVPGSLAINPALAGAEQRPVLDVSYFLLAGLKEEKGFGHVINIAGLYPARWGTLAGGLQFLNSEFNSLKLGTIGGVRLSYSKELTDNFLLGLGGYCEFGKDWGLGLDIGGLYKFGDLGFLKNSKLGISFTGLGKNYNPKTLGIKGKAYTEIPGIVTPHVGFATTFVDIDGFKLGMHFDISAPFFQNFVFNTGLSMEMADMLSFKTGFVFNTLETIYKKQTYIPSFNVGFTIKIKTTKNKDSFMKKQGWEDSEIKPEFSAKPFHNGIWGFGLGVNMHLGLKDDRPPKIELDANPIEPVYFSPNDDGELDAMEIPMKITDERFVTAWSCEIKDSNGKTVRTIANKVPLREMKDAKSFFALLGKSKKAVDVPPVLRWDGRTDSGELAEDGTYNFTVRAEDDNKNKGESAKYIVAVDKTYPEIELKAPSAVSEFIFSPDGDGNKDSFVFENTGSKEDLWLANIKDNQGKTVRTIKLNNSSLKPIAWDGKDDSGQIVPDGVYKYSIEATDKAKNKSVKTLSNIIVNTEKPSINITIDKKAFSPKDTTIEFTPSIPIKNGLVSWTIDVKNAQNKIVRSYKGDPKKIESVKFNGRDEKGSLLSEGNYKAFISANYINGHNPKTETPSFFLDITPPEARVSASHKLFSPDGDGKLDSVTFTQEQKGGDRWIGEIYKATNGNNIVGKPIYTIDFGKNLPPEFEWTGRKTDGSFGEDGKYAYILKGTDEAKNTAVSNTVIVELNTEKADIILQSNYTAFSPNKDGIKEEVEFYPVVKSKTKVVNYSLRLKNKSGSVVKKFNGTTPPRKIVWKGENEKTGKTNPDGLYSAEFEVELANKQTSKSILPNILIDTVYPTAEISVPYLEFSPRAGGTKKTLPISQISSAEERWTGKFVNSKNRVVRKITWNNKLDKFDWKAEDDLGNKVADGKYYYEVEAEDAAGNKTSQKLQGIIVDSREAKAYINSKHPVFSPTGKGSMDKQELSIMTNIEAGVKEWTVKISNVETGAVCAEWEGKNNLVKKFVWDGKDGKTKKLSPDGNYMATAYIEYKKGDIVTAFTESFILATQPPKLGVSLKPKYFSPDNDGTDDELFIGLKVDAPVGISKWKFEINEPKSVGGKLFWKTDGKERITDKIIWDGRSLSGETVQSATDYPFSFTVTDKAGMTSVYKGYIPVDILVIRVGDKLKIAVPSIIFRANANDFKGLDSTVVDKNNTILKRIAEILNKFPEYQVTVEGHANTTTGSEEEEIKFLKPLSKSRAEAVRDILIKHRVKKTRLSSIGMGGTQPVASLKDKENWWKNRRVEFILIKP